MYFLKIRIFDKFSYTMLTSKYKQLRGDFMLETLKKRKSICALFLMIMMLCTMLPVNVFAAEADDVVSKEKLVQIVTEDVDSLDFSSLGIDKVINNVNNTVEENVKKAVKEILTPENVKVLLKVTIKAEIKKDLEKYNIPEYIDIDKLVDDIIASKFVDVLLTNKLTQKVIDRTIDYAVSDIMNQVKLPTTSEIISISREKIINKSVEEVYNSDKKELLYYNYKIQFQGIKPVKVCTGWNETSIAAKVKLDASSVIAEECKIPDLNGVDYNGIIREAAKRAVRDVVKEEIINANNTIKNAIKDKIDEIISSYPR